MRRVNPEQIEAKIELTYAYLLDLIKTRKIDGRLIKKCKLEPGKDCSPKLILLFENDKTRIITYAEAVDYRSQNNE